MIVLLQAKVCTLIRATLEEEELLVVDLAGAS